MLRSIFVNAIIFKGKVSYPKDICFGPHTLILQQLCCNIIHNILFLKIEIFWDRDVEVLTNGYRGKLINMDPNKDFFELWLPLDFNVVTAVDVKFVHNLRDKPRGIANGRFPTPILNKFLHTQNPKIF